MTDIEIEGGLEAAGHENFATIGDDTLIERGDNELIAAFRARTRARAFGLGKSIVFGGLRPLPTDIRTIHSGSTKENET